MQKMLFFDIETRGNPEAVALLPEPKPRKNLVDPEKIEADIAEKKLARLDKAGLDPDLGFISSIGFATELGGPITPLLNTNGVDGEIALLEEFWAAMAETNGVNCGYNNRSFDMPWIMRRTMVHGMKIPYGKKLVEGRSWQVIPKLAKFQTWPTLDLMETLYNHGTPKGLKSVVRLQGIVNLLPELSGDKLEQMSDLVEIAYVVHDVLITMKLYEKMDGVYWNTQIRNPIIWRVPTEISRVLGTPELEAVT